MSDIPTARFIFVTGGVLSSLGKGLASASIAHPLFAAFIKAALRHQHNRPGHIPLQHHSRLSKEPTR